MRTKRGVCMILAALVLSASLLSVDTVRAAYGTHEPPRLMNLWFWWELTDEQVRELAKWDVVILDMDQQGRHPDQIRKLRRLNPNIKILAYIDSTGIHGGRFVAPRNTPGYKLAHSIPENWYLHRGKERVGFWPGAWVLNMTVDCPKDGQGRRWLDYLPQFIERELWSTGLWDGFFLDNALIGPTWFVGGGLDMHGDGRADSDSDVNNSWYTGWVRMAAELRKRIGPQALLMGNGAWEYAPHTNGIIFENFPNYGWIEGFKAYQTAYHHSVKPSITAINSNANNVNKPASYRQMRLGLGTSMLANGYYSFDYGDKNHGQTWWYDEYDAKIGGPAGPPTLLDPSGTSGVVEGVWWREYENGAVVVNSTRSTKHVELPSVYERLRGTQDSSVNNGRIETAVDLPARDALLLYRRVVASTSMGKSSAFLNGSFVRVYDEQGNQVRSAFFAQRSDVTGGSYVLSEDVDRDGKVDVVYASDGVLTIRFGNGHARSFRPFGASYRGSMWIAVGNVDRDDPWEVAVGRPGTSEVRIAELDGTVRAAWHAYATTFLGGADVAIGNLDGDDKREVVTGAGPTGGPHIRIFKTDGQVWGGGFFAYNPHERGGVSVAVGDVNRDGKDEIIAGSGEGSIPRVRIFTHAGELLREFTLSRTPAPRGVKVTVSDVDGDGTPEILASGVQVAP